MGATWADKHDEHMKSFVKYIIIGNLEDYLECATTDSRPASEMTRIGYNLCTSLVAFWEHAFEGDKSKLKSHPVSQELIMLREISNTFKHFNPSTPKHVGSIGYKRLRQIRVGGGLPPLTRAKRYSVEQGEYVYSLRDIPILLQKGSNTTINTLLLVTAPEIIKFSLGKDWLEEGQANDILDELDVLTSLD